MERLTQGLCRLFLSLLSPQDSPLIVSLTVLGFLFKTRDGVPKSARNRNPMSVTFEEKLPLCP